MLCKTEGIVFNYIKYRETSIITKIFTRELGLRSYIVNSIRTLKNKKIALFQPLTVLDLVVYERPTATLHRIAEVKCHEPPIDLSTDHNKMVISFFITEIVEKTIKEESPNEDLYLFLRSSIQMLEHSDKKNNNFHLLFLIKLSAYLGFHPNSVMQVLEDCGDLSFSSDEIKTFALMLLAGYNDDLQIDNYLRKKILNLLLTYFYKHIENMGMVNSAKILSEVMGK